jgi:hypothetical protein
MNICVGHSPQTRSASELLLTQKTKLPCLHDGMLEESPTPCSCELFGVNDQTVAARERYSGFISTSLLLLIFCIELIHEDEYRLLPEVFNPKDLIIHHFMWHFAHVFDLYTRTQLYAI